MSQRCKTSSATKETSSPPMRAGRAQTYVKTSRNPVQEWTSNNGPGRPIPGPGFSGEPASPACAGQRHPGSGRLPAADLQPRRCESATQHGEQTLGASPDREAAGGSPAAPESCVSFRVAESDAGETYG